MPKLPSLLFEVEFEDEEPKVVLNGVVLTGKEAEREEDHRIIMYDLFLWAQALKLAEKMESEREEFFDSLYDFSYGVVNLSDEPVHSSSTENKALYIISQKESYDHRIVRLKERYSRFKGLLNGLSKSDSRLLQNYFEHGHHKDHELVKECVGRLSAVHKKKELARERALDMKAKKEFAIQSRISRKEKGETFVDLNEGKQQYMVKGSFVYMTEEEYKNYSDQQKATMYENKDLIPNW